MMRPYFIGLQFLTRIKLVEQTNWTEEDFGQSVKFFPLIGATLGLCYAAIAYALFVFLPAEGWTPPAHLRAAIMLVVPIFFTGGLHCDGFMDTMDGLFSGRGRERMLEIMKDSRVGANGVFAFVMLLIFELCVILDLEKNLVVAAFWAMPIIGRLMMALAIRFFPYARPAGIGWAFKQCSESYTAVFAALTALILVAPSGVLAFLALAVSYFFMIFFARWATAKIGGLTGDIYGAIETLTEFVALLVFLFGGSF